MPATLTLKAPLKTHEGEVKELTLRDITAKDIIEIRHSPLSLTSVSTGMGAMRSTEQRVDIRYDVAFQYLVRLTGVDEVILGTIGGSDLTKATNLIVKMWNEAEGE